MRFLLRATNLPPAGRAASVRCARWIQTSGRIRRQRADHAADTHHHPLLRPPRPHSSQLPPHSRARPALHANSLRASQRSHRASQRVRVSSPGSSPQVYHDAVRRAASAHQVLRLAQPRVAANQPVDGRSDCGGRDCRAADVRRQDQCGGRHRAGRPASTPASHYHTPSREAHGPRGRPYSHEPGYGGYLFTLRPPPAASRQLRGRCPT